MNSNDSLLLPYPVGTNPTLLWKNKNSNHDANLTVDVKPLYVHQIFVPVEQAQRLLCDNKSPKTDLQSTLFESEVNEINSNSDLSPVISSYTHSGGWKNRLILGDSLLAMASMIKNDNLAGKVQAIYIDPPYGINFNKKVKLTTSRNQANNKSESLTPESGIFPDVKAYNDSWQDGISGYLNFLQNRLILAKELLAQSGSVFVQMGDENVHRVRILLDEIFGVDNFIATISYASSSGFPTNTISRVSDYILWYSKDKKSLKYRPLFRPKDPLTGDKHGNYRYIELPDFSRRPMTPNERTGIKPLPNGSKIYLPGALDSQGVQTKPCPVDFQGQTYHPAGSRIWTTLYPVGMERLKKANRIEAIGKNLRYIRYLNDFPYMPLTSSWNDTGIAGFSYDKRYVVQTNPSVVQRCILMSTDPGDLVLDPACGSGVTACVAEQWGRRWIAIDSSRLAASITRERLEGLRFPFYQIESGGTNPAKGFVYKKAAHITVKSAGTNEKIDLIWNKYKTQIEAAIDKLNTLVGQNWKDWEIPHLSDPQSQKLAQQIPEFETHLAQYWKTFEKRQNEINDAIVQNSETETLYDQPIETPKLHRCTSPFTIESFCPFASQKKSISKTASSSQKDFGFDIINSLLSSGIAIFNQKDRVFFQEITPLKAAPFSASGKYAAKQKTATAGIVIANAFETVSQSAITQCAQKAVSQGFDSVFILAFNFVPLDLGYLQTLPVSVYPVRINPSLQTHNELKNSVSNTEFVLYGEPLLNVAFISSNEVRLELNGVRIYNPLSEMELLDSANNVAGWFIDPDFNGQIFHAVQIRHPNVNLNPYRRWNVKQNSRQLNHREWDLITSLCSQPIDISTPKTVAVKIVSTAGDENITLLPYSFLSSSVQ